MNKIKIRYKNTFTKPISYHSLSKEWYIFLPNNLIKLFKYGIKYPILYWFNKKHYTGICECGHNFSEHHHGVIMNVDSLYYPLQVNGVIGQECEHNGFNGEKWADEDGSICRCNSYVDKGWIFRKNKDYKFRLHGKIGRSKT